MCNGIALSCIVISKLKRSWQYYNWTETTQFRSIYFHAVKIVNLLIESDTVETDNTLSLWRNTRSIFESWNISIRQMYFYLFRDAYILVLELRICINSICNFSIKRNTKIQNFWHALLLSQLPNRKSYDELVDFF